MGFSERWVNLMKECVSTVQYKVLVEQKEWGLISPGRGLRQGDPLSPCLFIIVAESLSAMLRVQERVGALHGVRVARGAPAVSHLFFADDCLFFFQANNLEAGVIEAVLREYGEAREGEVFGLTWLCWKEEERDPGVYRDRVFLLPKGLCDEIEKIMNSYWWGCESRGCRGIRWSDWSDLCRPKTHGGMGFRHVRDMNLAMLGK
ncbi:uncharacterized protein LOC116020140 [Ipomoea triloba]|uniref:uncharacterized protein LOC116020140 n=1 Tax=Ipomoea triloba TaxID=35885 RepID=UPI00125E5C15|nr:uncharacterized protein LOC116020140 [Ipomoea triloba]